MSYCRSIYSTCSAQTSYSIPAMYGVYSFPYEEWSSPTGSLWIAFNYSCTNDMTVRILPSYVNRTSIANSYQGQMYEIVLGGWGNTKSVLRYASQNPLNGVVSANDSPCTSGNSAWVSFDNTTRTLSAGYGLHVGVRAKLSYTFSGQYLYDIKYFG